MKRSCALRAATTAWRSVWVIGGSIGRKLIDQCGHPHAALDSRIVFEPQLRRSLHLQLPRDTRLEQTVRRRKAKQGRVSLLLIPEDGDVDNRLAEVGRHVDAGDCDQA